MVNVAFIDEETRVYRQASQKLILSYRIPQIGNIRAITHSLRRDGSVVARDSHITIRRGTLFSFPQSLFVLTKDPILDIAP